MPDAFPLTAPSTFRLRRRTPGSFLLVPCPKLGRSIRCQGHLEAAAAIVLVSCPAVTHLQEQPLSIWYLWRRDGNDLRIELLEYHDGLRPRNAKNSGCASVVPDFLIEMHNGKNRLLEIKPTDRLDRPAVPRNLAAMRMYAEREGWTFHLLTEKELVHGPLLSNLRLIGRYRRARVDDALLAKMQQQVPERGMPLGRIIHRLERLAANNARMHVFHLLANGRLSFEPTQRSIDDQTTIYPEGVITWDPFDSVWAASGCSTGGPGESPASWLLTGSSPKMPNSL